MEIKIKATAMSLLSTLWRIYGRKTNQNELALQEGRMGRSQLDTTKKRQNAVSVTLKRT